MPNKMLIDASHREETRVVVTRGNRIEEFDFESQDKKQLKGNIYLARVTRVEPSLQAAFVEYGGNRHGFLAFNEIHPDYYQIPVADRQALVRAEAEAARAEEEEEEGDDRARNGRRRRRGGKGRVRESATAATSGSDENAEGDAPAAIAAAADPGDDIVSEPAAEAIGDGSAEAEEGAGESSEDAEIESVGAEDAIEEARDRRRPVRRQYKIQEVIKRRQILLVQVVKEERGNKGAALTTYLSLAGRYSVLMPNTARGGGISRKITNAQDRKRLKDVVKDLDVPEGMGVILRTAGESRTKAEIKRDYEYLMRMWENVRTLTLNSIAPALVYEEGSLIKRSVRDLYNKDIDEILVAGEDGYREAKDFMRMLMPSHAKVVQPYRDSVPIFARSGIEAQLDRMLQPQVTLKSGGYVIINQTEALVSIDVNSGRATREHSIEDTALQTNLEAAEEIARQLRLRDLAGLIVIDFIDMEENRNNRAVEKKMKDCLKNDRARIQVGRISHFGLLEMSRQRIRASVLESTMKPCPHCGGTGHVRSDSSVALHVIRAIEEYLLKDNRSHITVRTPSSTAIFVLNHKRSNLIELEARFGLSISFEADESLGAQHYLITRGAPVEKPLPLPDMATPMPSVLDDEDEAVDEAILEEGQEPEAAEAADTESDRKRRRRRRRRGGKDRDAQPPREGEPRLEASTHEEEADDESAPHSEANAEDGAQDRKKRRRGRRGGRRNRREDEGEAIVADAGEAAPESVTQAAETQAEEPTVQNLETQTEPVSETAEEPAGEETQAPARKPRARTRKAKAAETEAAASEAQAEDAVPAEDKPAKAVRRPSRRKKVAEPEGAEAEGKIEGTRADAATVNGPPEAEQTAKPVAEDDALDEVADTPAPEPVVVTSAKENPERPKRGGWWQRKSFF